MLRNHELEFCLIAAMGLGCGRVSESPQEEFAGGVSAGGPSEEEPGRGQEPSVTLEEESCGPATLECVDSILTRVVCDGLEPVVVSVSCPERHSCGRDSAECKPWLCEPRTSECDEGVVRYCADDGLGYVGLTRECSVDQVCFDGQCRERMCAMDRCQGNTLVTCKNNGAAVAEIVCAETEYCQEQETGAACVPDICTPNEIVCESDDLKLLCNESGSAQDETSCFAGGLFCEEFGCAFYTQRGERERKYIGGGVSLWQLLEAKRDGIITGIDSSISSYDLPATFFVFEGDQMYGMQLVWSKLVEEPGRIYTGTGRFEYPVTKGKFYGVGIHRGGRASNIYLGTARAEAGPFILHAAIAAANSTLPESITWINNRYDGQAWGITIGAE